MTTSLATMFLIVIVISLPMSVPASASVVLVGSCVLASRLQQLISSRRIVHHRLIGRLLMPLDRKHGIVGNLGSCIAEGIGIRTSCHEAVLRSIFLDCLAFVPLHQSIKPSLAQKITLHFFRDTTHTGSTGSRPTVHPIHLVHTLLSPGRLL
jgi:hypothetical protein